MPILLGSPEDRPLTPREARMGEAIILAGAVLAAFTVALALVG